VAFNPDSSLNIVTSTHSTRALGELVANGFDAGADVVDIGINHNQLLGIDSIVVRDNGCGISLAVLKDRFFLLLIRIKATTFGRRSGSSASAACGISCRKSQ
jgi:hypothetical protein